MIIKKFKYLILTYSCNFSNSKNNLVKLLPKKPLVLLSRFLK